jgi:hypothetical protein
MSVGAISSTTAGAQTKVAELAEPKGVQDHDGDNDTKAPAPPATTPSAGATADAQTAALQPGFTLHM